MSDGIYLGVDPGRNGGLAACGQSGRVLDLCKMPETPEGILSWFRQWNKRPIPSKVHAALEKVGGYTKTTGVQPGSYMFNFGLLAGWAEMGLIAVGVKLVLVPPARWQNDLGITKRGKDESRTAFKRRLKKTAEETFPETKPTLATCDALLLAEWCRRRFTGKLQKGLLS